MIGVGQVLFAFFEDHLKAQKGLRPGSVRSYRDTMKLFLAYVAASCRRPAGARRGMVQGRVCCETRIAFALAVADW